MPIHNALVFINDTLNEFLKIQFSKYDDHTILNNLSDQTGSVPGENKNKIILNLVNFEQDNIAANTSHAPYHTNKQGEGKGPLPLHLTMYVLVVANMDKYPDSLYRLSAVMDYFHENSVFEQHAYKKKGFQTIQIPKLIVEMENMDFQMTHSLWQTIGASYQPSILYKVRMISIDNEFTPQQRITSVNQVN